MVIILNSIRTLVTIYSQNRLHSVTRKWGSFVKLLSKRVIRKVQKHEVKYLSSIFLRPKRDGSFRLILNLKKLNGNIDKIHFKMETLKTLLTLVTQDCYFASIDLKDNYYSILVHPDSQGWLAFYWDPNYYVFTALANGLSPAPRIYTKMLKPVFFPHCVKDTQR